MYGSKNIVEVKISFDTEKEDIDDLKRLIIALQDLVNKREKANSLGNPLATSSIIKPSQIRVETQVQQASAGGQTTGGGRVIPYEDMSGVLSKIVSGKY